MGADQIAQVRMFSAVQATVETHKASMPTGAPLLAPYGTFAALLSCLDRVPAGDQHSKSDACPDKMGLRAEVIRACLRFAAVLRSHGNATGNEDMQADGRISRAKLECVTDEAFPGAAHDILCWMDTLSSSVLHDYGIESTEVQDTYAALASFSKCTAGERHASARGAPDATDGPLIIAALIEILETMMDPAVELMAIAQPHFYREYFAARISVVTHDIATALQQELMATQPALVAALVPVEAPKEDSGRYGFYAQSA